MVAVALLAIGLCLLIGGLWVACALGLTGFVLIATSAGFLQAITALARLVWADTTNFVLIAIPLFVLMGEIVDRSGTMRDVYEKGAKLVRGLPGGLLQANVAACTLFAACTGSSIVAVSTIGKMSYPEMSRQGYNRSILLGTIAAGGTLGPLIPPSIVMIVFGDFCGVSVGKLFMAGVVPGLLMAGLFALMIGIRTKLRPEMLGQVAITPVTWKDRLQAITGLWPVFSLMLVVLGGIYSGVATPTEVAALGAALAMVFALVQKRLSWGKLKQIMLGTVRTTSMVLFIVIGAKVLAVSLAFHNIPPLIRDYFVSVGMPTTGFLIILVIMYLIIGMLFEALSTMIITLPFVLTVLLGYDINLVWFGVVLTILVGIGQLTPPVGLNLYVLSEVTGESVGAVVRGSLPFLAMEMVCLMLVMVFPNLALWLPAQMFGG